MLIAPKPSNEDQRIGLLRALELLDTPEEPFFDRIVRLVSRMLGVPIALVSLVDCDRQWFKSSFGLCTKETDRDSSFCAHAILGLEPFVVENALQDTRFFDNPLVTGDPFIRFYAGVPLQTLGGTPLGTLCAIDTVPRALTPVELETLTDLADLVSEEIQYREYVSLAAAQVNRDRRIVEVSEARYRTVFENAAVGIAIVSPDGNWVRVNDAVCKMLGYSKSELDKMTFQDVTFPDDLDKDLSLARQLMDDDIESYELEKRYIRKNGEVFWVLLSVTKKLDINGELDYFIGVIVDIDAKKRAEFSLSTLQNDLDIQSDTSYSSDMLFRHISTQMNAERALLSSEAELKVILEYSSDAHISVNEAGVVTSWNLSAEQVFGWEKIKAVGQRLESLIIPPKFQQAHAEGLRYYVNNKEGYPLDRRFEFLAMKKNGVIFPVEADIKLLTVGQRSFFSAFIRDISDRKAADENRDWEARHDSLTGLKNRRALMEDLPGIINDAKKVRRDVSVFFIDLDGFKDVNDSLGHDAGDTVLKIVAKRLIAAVREYDIVCRLAGDEFVIVLNGMLNGSVESHRLAARVIESVKKPIEIGHHFVWVSCSIGIAQMSSLYEGDKNPQDMLKIADSAMYEAKSRGKDQFADYVAY